MFFSALPKLRAAALVIAYDNGMINRESSEEAFLAEAAQRLKASCAEADLSATEAFLVGLTPEQWGDVLCGEQYTHIPAEVDAVLERVFQD